MASKLSISLTVNGQTYGVLVEPRRTLADVLRDDCHLTGTHIGCEHGICGACTVLVDDKPVRSCLMFGVQAEGKAIRTVEGLADGETLHPLQRAFIEHDALQCGFCTPGQIMSAVALLSEGRAGSADEIREFMNGNLCRCGAYGNIVAAIAAVASPPDGR